MLARRHKTTTATVDYASEEDCMEINNTRHIMISSVLLDNPDLDDQEVREIVLERFGLGQRYGLSRWEEHMSWNRRYIYTMICFLEYRAKYGRPTNAQSAITAWCNIHRAKWLAGLVFSAIGEPLDVAPNLRGPNFKEAEEWADVYAEKMRERDPDDRERIRSAIVRKPARDLAKADSLLRQLWPNTGDH